MNFIAKIEIIERARPCVARVIAINDREGLVKYYGLGGNEV